MLVGLAGLGPGYPPAGCIRGPDEWMEQLCGGVPTAGSPTAATPDPCWPNAWGATTATATWLFSAWRAAAYRWPGRSPPRLQAPLDVFLVRKLGVPQRRELAMGAMASGGGVVVNERLVEQLGVSEEALQATIEQESTELSRRERAYRGDRPPVAVDGKTVILVDDGIATGASMLAAVRAVRGSGAARVVVAAPVGAASACRDLGAEADEVVCASMPPDFAAVGQLYADFHQVSDDEVCSLMEQPTR